MQPSFLFHEGITLYATIFFIKMKTQREFNFYFDSYDDIFELKPMVYFVCFFSVRPILSLYKYLGYIWQY